MSDDEKFRRFWVYRTGQTRLETKDDLLGWGCEFPRGLCVVDWNLNAFPEENRLDHDHQSRYGSIDDVEQGTGGVVVFTEREEAEKERRRRSTEG